MLLERTPRTARLTDLPVSFFSIVLGLAGLGNTRRVAHRVWGLSASVGEAICLSSTEDGASNGHGPIFMGLYVQLLTRYLRLPAAPLIRSAADAELRESRSAL